MKPQHPERYVDGMRVDDDAEKSSAHDILADHLSNVSPATATAIQNAIAEHNRLQAEAIAAVPTKDATLAALRLVAELRCVSEVLQVLTRASDAAAIAIEQVVERTAAIGHLDPKATTTAPTNGTPK